MPTLKSTPRETPDSTFGQALPSSLTRQDYRAIILQNRKQQLEATAANLTRLMRTYDAAADELIRRVHRHGGKPISKQVAENLIGELDAEIVRMTEDYRQLLDAGALQLAQVAAQREERLAEKLLNADDPTLTANMTQVFNLSSGQRVEVAFGRLARNVVEKLAGRYYRDGLTLSERVWQIDEAGRRAVEDTIVQGMAEQLSAVRMAARLREAFYAQGVETPRYLAMRLARTEIVTAHREATIQAGMGKDYIVGVKWNLSAGHPAAADVCDLYAAHDSGMGTGVYRSEDVPTSHPNCICFQFNVVEGFEDMPVPASKKPKPGDVPDTDVRYYAAQGDAPASAEFAAREGALVQ